MVLVVAFLECKIESNRVPCFMRVLQRLLTSLALFLGRKGPVYFFSDFWGSQGQKCPGELSFLAASFLEPVLFWLFAFFQWYKLYNGENL